jgi:YHS domain-containing protein
MEVAVTPTTPSVEYGSERHYFCCQGCAAKFENQPDHYRRLLA